MILLDTHVLLWWLDDDPRLGAAARSRLADVAQGAAVSAVSVFEVETKRRIGKLVAPGAILEAVRAERFGLVPLDAREGVLGGRLDWSHRDPFDRLLIAQSRLREAPLLTADARVLDFEPTAIDASD